MRRRQFLRAAGLRLAAVAKPAIAQSSSAIKWRLTSSFPRSVDTAWGAVETIVRMVGEATDNQFQMQPFAAGEVVPGSQAMDAVLPPRLQTAAAVRLRAIKTDILSGLNGHERSLASLAARHGVTPRYVQMLFKSEGTTFSRFLRDQRLERAHRMVGDPRYTQRTISTIAYDVGFGDLSHFNRAFRRQFGKSPSEVRAAASCNGGLRPSQSIKMAASNIIPNH
jgi:AraC-like DNA-binding protein